MKPQRYNDHFAERGYMNTWRTLSALLVLALSELAAIGQGDGKLQIHYMDVGQGDGEVLISLKGQVVVFDDGVAKNCDKPVSYLQQLGSTKSTTTLPAITTATISVARHRCSKRSRCQRSFLIGARTIPQPPTETTPRLQVRVGRQLHWAWRSFWTKARALCEARRPQ